VDRIACEFGDAVRKLLGNRVRSVTLFGSYARGEQTEGSDRDVLVVVDEYDRSARELVTDVAVRMLDTYGTLFGCLVWGAKEWESKRRYPLGLNIAKEGVPI